MVNLLRSNVVAATLVLTCSFLSSCDRIKTAVSSDSSSPEPGSASSSSNEAPHGTHAGTDRVRQQIDAFRYKTRGFYNTSNFKALEDSMAEIRSNSEPRFGNGAWKLQVFYESLECDKKEKESMWQLHDRIHKEWIKAYPQSITARVAYADYLISYAWFARGSGWSNTVTPEGWRLMGERLAAAHQVLLSAKSLTPQCPMWWRLEMRIALGQGWSHADLGKVYNEGKQFAPQFQNLDYALVYYLLPRWYGKEGDWEKAAAAEMKRPEGLGAAGYALSVIYLEDFYDNIFKESHASWPDTRAGLEALRKSYPNSLEIVSQSCRLACLAGDQTLARTLFQQLEGYQDNRVWNDGQEYQKLRSWATGSAN
jgi:hypothetical protein